MAAVNQQRVAVIMAGGSGERFWPLSRAKRPKQLLPLNRPDKSMLEESIDLAAAVVGKEHVYIVTGSGLADAIIEMNIDFPSERLIIEPCKKNTAGALIFAAAWLSKTYNHLRPEEITVAVLSADPRITETALCKEMMEAALTGAEQHHCLVTCGITPSRPDTGFGYIEPELNAPLRSNHESTLPLYPVKAFHEKPGADRARVYLESRRYFWNSGMFFWRLSVFLEELRAAAPSLMATFSALLPVLQDGRSEETARLFESLEAISIDHALLERSTHVAMVRGDFSWDDVGTWNGLPTPEACDEQMNYTRGDPIVLDCDHCVIYNAGGAKEMAVGVIGMSHVVVVTTPDGVLVLPRDRAQEVRRIVEELKKRDAHQR